MARWDPNLISPYMTVKVRRSAPFMWRQSTRAVTPCCLLTKYAAVSCRAFRQEEKQTKRNADLVDKNIIMSLLQMSMNRCEYGSPAVLYFTRQAPSGVHVREST